MVEHMMTQLYASHPMPETIRATQQYPGNPRTAQAQPNFDGLLRQFAPISLSQMDDVALLNRTDTKFVLTAAQLYVALASLTADYQVLDVAGVRLNHYQTLYFDTPDFAMYLRHHAGGRERYKVRSRQYLDSSLTFLEVKRKTNKNRTIKSRLRTPSLVTAFGAETNLFLHDHLPPSAQALEPKLWNNFVRITLVNKVVQERLTLDLNLRFSQAGETIVLPGLAIAEVKQNGVNPDSPFIRHMRAMNLHPTGFSKYCLGVAMLYPSLKHNHFKPKLRLVEQLIRGNDYVH